MKTFIEFLADKHADGYMGTDDNMPADFDRWQTELQVDELIEYADEYRGEATKT